MRTIMSLTVAALMTSTASASDWYSSVYGGANWDDVISAEGVSDNTGFVIGGTLGKRIPAVPGLRIEADLAFRQNVIDIDWCSGFSVDHDTTTLMANAVYDLPVAIGPLHPYVQAGVGYGHSEARLEDVSIASVEASGVAWQLGAGLNTQLADGVVFGIGYRFVQAPEIEVFGTEISDGGNHSAVAQLTFALD